MKITYLRSILIIGISALFALISCNKDVTPVNKLSSQDLEINTFIWQSMHDYYLWTSDVPNLSLSGTNLTNFENKYADHNKTFEELIYNREHVDKWSWIVDDYVALENQFNGIYKSTGMNFKLGIYNLTGNVCGFVRYVVKGSPADKAGINRGDVFIAIDNQKIDTLNYQTLLNKETSTYSFGTISSFDSKFPFIASPNGVSKTITSAEVQENPIYMDTVLNVGGFKIGYLVYNQFMGNYENELNDVFGKFKNQGIQKLILDLRYNPGGSMATANYLTSMIYGTYTNQICFKIQYNTALQDYFVSHKGSDFLNHYFTDTIARSDYSVNANINTLNLKEVYIIATSSTASASELVINSLNPYINVVIIGSNTVGKYVGSTTLKDWDNLGNVNPNHKWAIQPIILKYSNSQGVSDFVNGFTPTIAAKENPLSLLPFGDLNEPLLKTTLNKIQGIVTTSKSATEIDNIKDFKDSKDLIPHGKEMYLKIRK